MDNEELLKAIDEQDWARVAEIRQKQLEQSAAAGPPPPPPSPKKKKAAGAASPRKKKEKIIIPPEELEDITDTVVRARAPNRARTSLSDLPMKGGEGGSGGDRLMRSQGLTPCRSTWKDDGAAFSVLKVYSKNESKRRKGGGRGRPGARPPAEKVTVTCSRCRKQYELPSSLDCLNGTDSSYVCEGCLRR